MEPLSRVSRSARRRRSVIARAARWATLAASVIVCAAVGTIAAIWLRMDPLPLTRAEAVSVTVLDRNDRLLRAYTAADGRWRLPLDVKDVDPRYLAILIAFEDKRFRSHRGVDPWAVGRAAWQLIGHQRIVSGGSTLTMQVARIIAPESRWFRPHSVAGKGVQVTEYRAGDDPEKRREMIQRSHGGYTYPQVFINGRHAGGSDEIHDLDRAGENLARETGKPFQKEISYEQDWQVRGMRNVGGKPHVALERWDAVTLAPVPRGVDLNVGQKLELGPDKALKLARGLGPDR